MKFYLRHVSVNAQGYVQNKYYYGLDAPLWYYESTDGTISEHIRASSRDMAKYHIKKKYPTARFFR